MGRQENPMPTNLGETITALYAHFMDLFGDPELASVATAAVVNDILSRDPSRLEG